MTTEATCDIGLIGLGVMGRNFLLNMGDKGFKVAGTNRSPDKVEALQQLNHPNVVAVQELGPFVAQLKTPRAIIILVTAGKPVDVVINELVPLLSPGDTIIDGGNSYYEDTNRRETDLTAKGLNFLGVGVSGGEEGARRGPCLMPGGPKASYDNRIRQIFEAASAHVNGEPCVEYLGPNSAGHYVKMVHNGIEYGLMQIISETYDLMHRGLGMNDDELHQVYKSWNEGELNSFLIEITADVFAVPDNGSGTHLVDVILDVAKQKGTGLWTSQDAMRLNVPTPTIDMAVSMRDLSVFKTERQTVSKLLAGPTADTAAPPEREAFLAQLQQAMAAAMILTYAQGMSLLQVASEQYGYGLNLADVARIWRGGCIIRAQLLEDLRKAFSTNPQLSTLLLDENIANMLTERQGGLRKTIEAGVALGIPVPGLMSALGYYDGYRSPMLPANLIQAQRDYFGSHTYQRIDQEGTFHTEWAQPGGGGGMTTTLTPTQPTVFVIFGGKGDLSWRKLIPSLFILFIQHQLPENFKILGLGREALTDDQFREHMDDGVHQFSRLKPVNDADWDAFSGHLSYVQGDFTKPDAYPKLEGILNQLDQDWPEQANRIFYLATPSNIFGTILESLGQSQAAKDVAHSRVVVEKPIGHDLPSAQALNTLMARCFHEDQIFRIDHYLGKETVQNILAFRFANPMFEPVWNRTYIDYVTITVAEDLGVEGRGGYYDKVGALRDMIQNHLMQLLCLVAMEPPISFEALELRNKRVEVLNAIRPIPKDEVSRYAVRGQYGPGWTDGKAVPGYRQENGIPDTSINDTFAALKVYVDNWRWEGVPFYMRTGKRMAAKCSEISIQFRHVPHHAFPPSVAEDSQPARLVLCIQPTEGITLKFHAKEPGKSLHLRPVDMAFCYKTAFKTPSAEAYETLLWDVVMNDHTLFMRADQVEASWKVLTPVLSAWDQNEPQSFPNYNAGSWGPEAAERLIAQDGHTWFEPTYLCPETGAPKSASAAAAPESNKTPVLQR